MSQSMLFVIAFRAIWRNKVRSLLTMLGVIIGVMSVILLLAIGSGLQTYITQEFEALGTNLLIINPGEGFSEGSGATMGASQMSSMATSKLRFSDVQKLKKLRQYVKAVIPEFMASSTVSYRAVSKSAIGIYGTSSDFTMLGGFSTDKGDFFTKTDEDSKKRVVVMGPGIATEIFGEVDPVGRKIIIADATFEVIGVMAKQSGMMGAQMDKFLIMPITTAQDLFKNEQLMSINVVVQNKDEMPQAEKAIESLLLERLKDDEFHIMDQEQVLGTINNILTILSLGLSGIAAISLLVGGIGIMNIMLVSVTERTKEIGLRKAVGATPGVILMQFLIESSLLSITGGFIGVAIAFLISLIMRQFFPATVTLWSVGLAFGVSAFVGILFGVLPARKAANLSPIEALRYE